MNAALPHIASRRAKRSSALCLVLLAGCAQQHSARGEPPARDEVPADPQAFAQLLLEKGLDRFQQCCERVGLMSATTPSAALPPPGTHLDRALAATCLEDLGKMPCDSEKRGPAISVACMRALSGSVGQGQLCSGQWDCAQVGGPNQLASCSPGGTCVALSMQREGEPCDGPNHANQTRRCEAPLVCNEELGTCQRRARIGEPCVVNMHPRDTCVAGAVCDRNGTRRCLPARDLGASCSQPEHCEHYQCVDGTCRDQAVSAFSCVEPD